MNKEFQSNRFILTKYDLVNTKDEFKESMKLSTGTLYYDDQRKINAYDSSEMKIVIIGYLLDITDGSKTQKEISIELIDLYQRDYQLFLDKIDLLNGRYNLILDNGNYIEIYTDATCLRPLFYWDNEIFGSHESLVRYIVEIEKELKLQVDSVKMKGLLDFTSTQDIYKFNSNSMFSSKNSSFTRIYPRQEFKELNLDEVYEQTKDFFQTQVEWLDNNYNDIYLSLTGGFDSKVSLAISKKIKSKIKYFTYMINTSKNSSSRYENIFKIDKWNVENLVENLDLNHKMYYFKEYEKDDEYIKNINENVSSEHSYELANVLNKELTENSIHIKSTIYELVKLPYLDKYDDVTDASELISMVKNWVPKEYKHKNKMILRMIEEFIHRNDYDTVLNTKYLLPSIIYWESRMGNWHGDITQETDLTSETFVFINNRFMLDKFIRLDQFERKNNSYLKKIIDDNWPILNYYIPNTKDTLADKLNEKENVKVINRRMNVINMKNIVVQINEGVLSVEPMRNIKLKDDSIYFSIENNFLDYIDVEFKSFYKHKEKNIFIHLNDKRYSINELNNGIILTIKPDRNVKVEIEYTTNFLKDSWYKAALLEMKIV